MKLTRAFFSLLFLIPLIGLAGDDEDAIQFINQKDDLGRTPLHIAAGAGDAHTVLGYIKAGADPSIPEFEGVMPLHRAAAEGHIDVVTALVEEGHVDVNALDNDGETPLDYADGLGREAVANYLIEHGGEVGNRAENEDSELYFSALTGGLEEDGEGLFYSTLEEPDVGGETPIDTAQNPDVQVTGDGGVFLFNMALGALDITRAFCDEMYGNGSI